MANFLQVADEVAIDAALADDVGDLHGGGWIDITAEDPQPGIGWSYIGGVWSPPVTTKRTLLTGAEWINTWTHAEWRNLKRAASGDLSPTPIAEEVSQRLDQLLDEIDAYGGKFDVGNENPRAEQFYQYLEDQNFITPARRAELQEGI